MAAVAGGWMTQRTILNYYILIYKMNYNYEFCLFFVFCASDLIFSRLRLGYACSLFKSRKPWGPWSGNSPAGTFGPGVGLGPSLGGGPPGGAPRAPGGPGGAPGGAPGGGHFLTPFFRTRKIAKNQTLFEVEISRSGGKSPPKNPSIRIPPGFRAGKIRGAGKFPGEIPAPRGLRGTPGARPAGENSGAAENFGGAELCPEISPGFSGEFWGGIYFAS